MKFVLATHNPGKLKEMADILSGLGVEVVSPADVGISVDVEETGTTRGENDRTLPQMRQRGPAGSGAGAVQFFSHRFFVNAKIQRYVCRSCGYTEEWIAQESMEKLRQSTWHDEK